MGNCNYKNARQKEPAIINKSLLISQQSGSGQEPVMVEYFEKCKKSVCKIYYYINKQKYFGTGFFMKYNNNNYLFTCKHVIISIQIRINLELWNNNIVELNLLDREVLFFNELYDIAVIEIKNTDIFINEIEFLDYDSNYEKGYKLQYEDATIFYLGYPYGNKMSIDIKKIEGIHAYNFFHNLATKSGSSGSPIILSANSKVIGIHRGVDHIKNKNYGIFIGEVLKELKKGRAKAIPKNEIILNNSSIIEMNNTPNNNKNEILAIYVKRTYEINLLCNYNNTNKCFFDYSEKVSYMEAKKNINENNTELFVNNRTVPFDYIYKSNEEGEIKVKFKFKKLLTNTSYMFSDCESLIALDLSLFDTSKVKDMNHMFNCCKSLITLNISSLNTSNVINMYNMFSYCKSLMELDLSSFDISNVIDMNSMFSYCSSLKSLNLSSFNKSNVNNLNCMFCGCKSLTSLDLSSFDTSNVMSMNNMFAYCYSLTSLNLSSFDTSSVIYMNEMFLGCKALISLDLSSFDTTNVRSMNSMFAHCEGLKFLDLSSFDITNGVNMEKIFKNCRLLYSHNVKVNNKSCNILDELQSDCLIF